MVETKSLYKGVREENDALQAVKQNHFLSRSCIDRNQYCKFKVKALQGLEASGPDLISRFV